jgi:hypothetical protein
MDKNSRGNKFMGILNVSGFLFFIFTLPSCSAGNADNEIINTEENTIHIPENVSVEVHYYSRR